MEEEICVGCLYVLDNNPLLFTCIADISLRLHLFFFFFNFVNGAFWTEGFYVCFFNRVMFIHRFSMFTFYWFKSIPGFALYIYIYIFFLFSTSCATSTLLTLACMCREDTLSPSLPQYTPLKYSETSSNDLHRFIPC